ncbi:MAG: hypothetical protein IJ149_10780 [Oscillospiraceae bacterium]|nr:hypothetical protein [Oscillospiraceae bacterium]MBQ9210042.1 hypothetical protein [Oscillospiraceae bacterium]
MGANCRHTFYPFIPGVSQRNYTEDELRSIDPPPFEYEGRTYTAYEASQKQRQIEREIRKTKREIIAAEATGDKDRLTVKAVRLRRQKELYHDFSKAAGLREQKERMQVNGYDRSKSMKTVWAENTKFVEDMKAKGVENPPKSLASFRRMEYNEPEKYKQLSNYVSSVDSGMMSPLTGFKRYSDYYGRIEKELVGQATSNGILIQGQSKHLLERVFGTMNDPAHGGTKRSGVEFEDVKDALLNGKTIPAKTETLADGTIRSSQVLYNDKATVSINPDTGIIIQCEPRRRGKK